MAAEVLQVVAMEVEIKEDLKVTTWTSLLLEKIWEEVQQEYLQDSLVKDHLVLDKVHHQDMEAQWEGLDQDNLDNPHQEVCRLIWTLNRGHLVPAICLEEMIL